MKRLYPTVEELEQIKVLAKKYGIKQEPVRYEKHTFDINVTLGGNKIWLRDDCRHG